MSFSRRPAAFTICAMPVVYVPPRLKVSILPPCRSCPMAAVTRASLLPDIYHDRRKYVQPTQDQNWIWYKNEWLYWVSGELHSYQVWFYHVHVHFSLLLFFFSFKNWKAKSQRTENISLKLVAKDSQVIIPCRRASVSWLNHKLSVMPVKKVNSSICSLKIPSGAILKSVHLILR